MGELQEKDPIEKCDEMYQCGSRVSFNNSLIWKGHYLFLIHIQGTRRRNKVKCRQPGALGRVVKCLVMKASLESSQILQPQISRPQGS